LPHRHTPRPIGRAACWMLAAAFLGVAATRAAAEPVDPWTKGAEWFTVRAGYAKSTAAGAADGNVGLGFSYTRFKSAKWSYGGTVEWNVLGKFADARELEIPWTVEITRHYKWPTDLRPYLGLGLGAYYHQFSGTGDDGSTLEPGGFLSSGFNMPISDNGLFGLDVRMNVVHNSTSANPVFGGEVSGSEPQNHVQHWGVKFGYSWVF
jgi:hypothetical protein